MKIPAGHQIKLMKKINQLGGPDRSKVVVKMTPSLVINENDEKEIRSSTAAQSSDLSNKREKTVSNYVELDPPGEDFFTLTANQSTTTKNSNHNTSNLLQGNYDEEASKASFQEALNEWRQGKKEVSTVASNSNTPNEKFSCWQCYKLITNEKIFEIAKKKFCSEGCLEKYRTIYTVIIFKILKINSRLLVQRLDAGKNL
jgi:hypothetical protein